MMELLRINDIELNSYDSEHIKMQVEAFLQQNMSIKEVARYLSNLGKPFVKKDNVMPYFNHIGDKLKFSTGMEFTLIFIQEDNSISDIEFPLHPQIEENGDLLVYKRYKPKDEEEIERLVGKFKNELPNIVTDFIVKNCHDVSDEVMKQTYEILKQKYMYKEEKFQ